MAGTKFTVGPAYVANAAADIYTPPASTMYRVIYHIRCVNKAAATPTVSLYRGLTGGSAGGTEIITAAFAFTTTGTAGAEKDWYWPNGLLMLSTHFLSGVASAASQVVIIVTGETLVMPA